MAKKILIAIFSLILVGCLVFCVVWTIVNFEKVEQGISGTSLYTKEDVDTAYKDGYDTAVKDKEELLLDIDDLREALSKKETELQNLEIKLSDYNSIKSELSTLKGEKIALEKEIANLKITLETYEDFIEEVKIAGMKVVSYEYDGAIIGLQRYNEGETLNVIDSPADTENVKFIGWTLDGSTLVDLSNFTVNENVTFVAKLSKSYFVNFMVDGEVFSTQKVAESGSCSIPSETPDKFGYTFAGWSLDGVNVLSSIEQEVVLGDVNYIAVFDLFEVKIKFKFIPKQFLVNEEHITFSVLNEIPWSVGSTALFFEDGSSLMLDFSAGFSGNIYANDYVLGVYYNEIKSVLNFECYNSFGTTFDSGSEFVFNMYFLSPIS